MIASFSDDLTEFVNLEESVRGNTPGRRVHLANRWRAVTRELPSQIQPMSNRHEERQVDETSLCCGLSFTQPSFI